MDNKKIRHPITKGIAKVPVIIQLEMLECGAAALAMVMAYYGKWVPLEQVRLDCGVSRDGSNAKNMVEAAKYYGFNVKAYRMSHKSIRTEASFPCIIHWNFCHFVVLCGFKDKWVYINDPARGNVRIPEEEFNKLYSGIVIIPTPSDDFVPSGKPQSTLDYAKKRLVGTGVATFFLMLTTAIAYLFGIFNSVTARIFIDRILTGKNPEWLQPFIGILIVFSLVQLIVMWINAIYSIKIDGKMAVVGNTTYMWKVLKLPMEFFSQRLAGDIQARANLSANISSSIVKTLTPLLLNSAMMIFYFVLMVKQSALLASIGIVTVAINVFVSKIIADKRINITRILMSESGKLVGATVTGINLIDTIKSSGSEEVFFQKWAGIQANINEQNVKLIKTTTFLSLIPAVLDIVANYIVLIIGVLLTIAGEFTIGSVVMFQGFLSSFIDPAEQLIEAGKTIQEMRTNIERVEDVISYPSDENIRDGGKIDNNLQKLSGNIEINNISFGYARLDEPFIKDFSLSVKAGQSVAIVGKSGCGKSTMSSLIAGLYKTWSGEILFDGKTRSEYSRETMVGSIAVVDQDIILFEDTIENNIKMWDESIKDFEMILAARDAALHDEIMALPNHYKYKLEYGGKNLSGGQKQRMEIARVLAQDPSIIILDEATSSLDAVTEHKVVEAIRNRGITCIVIAHRLSTIRDCDEIVVMDKGRIVEQGTHDDLIKQNGLYMELITNE